MVPLLFLAVLRWILILKFLQEIPCGIVVGIYESKASTRILKCWKGRMDLDIFQVCFVSWQFFFQWAPDFSWDTKVFPVVANPDFLLVAENARSWWCFMCLALNWNKGIVKDDCPLYLNRISILTYLFREDSFKGTWTFTCVFCSISLNVLPYCTALFLKNAAMPGDVSCVRDTSMILMNLFSWGCWTGHFSPPLAFIPVGIPLSTYIFRHIL